MSYYEYPEDDLYECKEKLEDVGELVKFLMEILRGLATLESVEMVHGNLKPEFLHFNKKTQNYILLDRLANFDSFFQA